MRVQVIAWTQFDPEVASQASGMEYEPEQDLAADLSEFAGRQCYRSWARPNPGTARNAGYLRNILKQGHFSVLEHGSVSFHIGDVSRSLTHELIRHRHLSYSQLSQRFVLAKQGQGFVVPPLYRHNDDAITRLERVWYQCLDAYDELIALADDMPTEVGRKQAREAARAVLPNMTPTDIVVTGNHRAWREMLVKRGTVDADAEMCELAVELFNQLSSLEPNIYQDMGTITTDTGRTIIVQGSQEPGKASAGPLGMTVHTPAVGAASVASGGSSVERFEVTTVDTPVKGSHLYKGRP
jgi:thymidylate synthase (FAD)